MTATSCVERVRDAIKKFIDDNLLLELTHEAISAHRLGVARAAIAAYEAAFAEDGLAIRPREPTAEMMTAARDWSLAKYGKPIGNPAAVECWRAMFDAAPK